MWKLVSDAASYKNTSYWSGRGHDPPPPLDGGYDLNEACPLERGRSQASALHEVSVWRATHPQYWRPRQSVLCVNGCCCCYVCWLALPLDWCLIVNDVDVGTEWSIYRRRGFSIWLVDVGWSLTRQCSRHIVYFYKYRGWQLISELWGKDMSAWFEVDIINQAFILNMLVTIL